MRKNTLPRALSALLAVVLLLSLAPMALATLQNDTLIYAIDGDPGNDINPISTSGRFDLMAERMLYSTLYNYYGDDDITWLLAESMDVSEDMRTLTVHLRDGVVWHDGEPFTSADVVYTYEMIMTYPHANGYDGLVYNGEKIEVEAIDDLTVEFRIPVTNPAIIELLPSEHYIFPKHIYDGDETFENNPKNAEPVGTGPYKLGEYVAGQYLRFEANEDYFLGAPNIQTIIYQVVTDKNSAMLALRTGEINALIIDNANAVDFEGSDVEIHAYPEDRVGYVAFNMASDRVQDENLRKAVFYAFNRDEINTGAYLSEEFYENAYSFLPSAALYWTDDLERYDNDVEKAKELLAEVDNIPTLRIAFQANNPTTETQALIMQQNLRNIGIDLELQATEWNSLVTKMEDANNQDYDLFISGYIMGTDPLNYATMFVSDSAYNYSHMSDQELDDLFAAGATEIDTAKREEIYVSAQQRLAGLAVQYPLVTNMRLLGVTADVDPASVEAARLVPIYTFEDMSKLAWK